MRAMRIIGLQQDQEAHLKLLIFIWLSESLFDTS
jgi:hypothetical protein